MSFATNYNIAINKYIIYLRHVVVSTLVGIAGVG